MGSLWFSFVLALLATWRLTHLISREDGPADVLLRLRVRAGTGILGQLMDCFNCLSLWIAAPLAFVVGRTALETLLSWLALSGGACLLERIQRGPITIRDWTDTQGEDDELLWRQASGAAESPADRIGASATGTSTGKSGRSRAAIDYDPPREKGHREDS